MKVLVLHRVRYQDIRYEDAIDHHAHDVYYLGSPERLAELPAELPCTKIERDPGKPLFDDAVAAIEAHDIAPRRVMAVHEFELMDAARLRERYSVPGPKPADVEPVRDKTVMKARAAAAGLDVPAFAEIAPFLSGAARLNPARQCVLKPKDGASSIGVAVFAGPEEARSAIEGRKSGVADLDGGARPLQDFEVEEFVDGPVLHIDGYIKSGIVEVVVASRYIGTLFEFVKGRPCGSVQIPMPDGGEAFVQTALRSVGLQQGVFHLEAIASPEGLVFLEVAHRAGGARICETFARKTGVHLSVVEVAQMMDCNHMPDLRWDEKAYGWFIVPGHHLGAEFVAVTGHETLTQRPEFIVVDRLGPECPLSGNVTYKESELPLAGMLAGHDGDALAGLLEALFEEVRVEPAQTARNGQSAQNAENTPVAGGALAAS